MAALTIDGLALPFTAKVAAVNSSLAEDFIQSIDFKVCGIDSLVDTLNDPERMAYAQKWQTVVLSIPVFPERIINKALDKLSLLTRRTIQYEYVDQLDAILLNYNFDLGKPVDDTIVHSCYIRSGRNTAFLAPSVRNYIRIHNLYFAAPPSHHHLPSSTGTLW